MRSSAGSPRSRIGRARAIATRDRDSRGGVRKASIAEVAAAAGVSPATVSRVLNDTVQVTPETRERVENAVAQLNYRPNRLARNMRKQRAEMFGVVISDIENPHFTALVRSVEDAAYRLGYRVVLCNTDESAAKQRAYLEMLADEHVLGVILVPSDPAGAEIAELLDRGIAVVAFDRPVADPRADAVVANNREGARAATQHLLDKGHRRIGFLGGPRHVGTGSERLEGYQEAMAAAGAEPLVADGGFRIEGAGPATASMLAHVPRITGLVVANNLMTLGALDVLAAQGIPIPEEVAVVSIDDPFWAALIAPPLTAFAQPVRRMAGAAMTQLLDRIEGRRTEPAELRFDLELHERRSSGGQRKRP